MLIESDLIIAYMKKEDWLKEHAEKIFRAIEENGLVGVKASSEVFHELYYVFSDYASLSIILGNSAKLATMKNLSFVDPTKEVYLSALSLMETYGISSIFDAIYAATALTDTVPDHTLLSTDLVYDRIRGIKRIDPRTLQF
jgi:predicted nucleic acid-binding protein